VHGWCVGEDRSECGVLDSLTVIVMRGGIVPWVITSSGTPKKLYHTIFR